MSDDAPWLETWEIADDGAVVTGTFVVVPACLGSDERRLIAAAPQLARALALVEWQAREDLSDYNSEEQVCPECGHPPTAVTVRYSGRIIFGGHAEGCSLDAALTAAGLVTQEQREEARRWGT